MVSQSVSKDSDYGFKDTLLSLTKFLDKGLPSALSGVRSTFKVKEDSQDRRIKFMK